MIQKTKGRTAAAVPTPRTFDSPNSSPIAKLLSRLDGARRTGPGKWVAKCPTRPDRSPSLSIRELPDGRLLIYDFGGDSVEEVLAAVGLTMADLYPDRPRPPAPGEPHRERRPFAAEDALACLDFEASIVLLMARDLLDGFEPSEEDYERLSLAVERIEDAMVVCHG